MYQILIDGLVIYLLGQLILWVSVVFGMIAKSKLFLASGMLGLVLQIVGFFMLWEKGYSWTSF